jgi:hypothetical protein
MHIHPKHRRGRRAAVLLVPAVFLTGASAALAAGSIYVANGVTGSGAGTSCSNARSAAWFNSSSSWGTSAGQIGPGTTVYLCGTITTNLTLQGNGASGNHVVVDGSNAVMSAGFSETSRSWWKIENVTWSSGFSGVLLNMRGGSNGVFNNNHADNFSGGNAVFLGQNAPSLPNAITISNNFIRTAATDFGNSQHDIIVTEGSTNVVIEGNYLEMRAGGSGSYAHDDVIQTYEKGGSSGGPPSNWTIRYNKIVMNSGERYNRSWGMLESLAGTNNIYGNVFLGLSGAGEANGLCINSSRSGVVFNIFNNTFVAKSGASNNVLSLSDAGPANLRNNIIHTSGQTALIGSMAVNRDHNLWFGSNIPGCRTTELCGVDPRFVSYVNNDFTLATGSPAIDAGANLGTTFNGSIAPGATWPDPALGQRPSAGNWNLGAYETGGSGDLTPPYNLRVVP